MKTFLPTRGLISTVTLLSLVAVRLHAETRTWKDATGAFSLEAEYVEIKNGKVSLKKADGKIIEVEISKLSSNDQKFLKLHDPTATNGVAGSNNVTLKRLAGKPEELVNDDGKVAGKKSFPRGIASEFRAASESHYLTSVKIHCTYGLDAFDCLEGFRATFHPVHTTGSYVLAA